MTIGLRSNLLGAALAALAFAVGLVMLHKQPRVDLPTMAASSELREGLGGSGEAVKP
jgi:hypothetical protein